MTFSVLFTFTDFQLIYVLTRGGPLNATHLMATLSFQRAISGGSLGEGAAIATAMVPFLLAAILFSYFGLQRRAWQQGGRTNERRCEPRRADSADTQRHELPRVAAAARGHGLPAARACSCSCCCSRSTGWRSPSFKPNDELLVARRQSVLGDASDARPLQEAAVRHRRTRTGCGTRSWSRSSSTFLSLVASVLAAYAIERLRFRGSRYVGHGDLPRLPGAAVDPVHPARGDRLTSSACSTRAGADPHLSDVPDPVLHVAADGLLPLDSRSSSRNAR